MQETGVNNILIKNEIFRPVSLKSAMSGGDYIRGKDAMSIFPEALQRLQIRRFLESLEQSPKWVHLSGKFKMPFKKPEAAQRK